MKNYVSIGLAIISVIGSIIFTAIGYKFSLSTMFNDVDSLRNASLLVILILGTLAFSGLSFLISIKENGFEGPISIITGVVILIAAVFSITTTIAGIVFLVVAGFIFYSIFND